MLFSFCEAPGAKPHLAPVARQPFLSFGFAVEAGNVLLHAARISNDDVPSAPCFEWLKVK